jgi:hypothetical protein
MKQCLTEEQFDKLKVGDQVMCFSVENGFTYQNIKKAQGDLFCSCSNPQLVHREVLFQSYRYCTKCGKERV